VLSELKSSLVSYTVSYLVLDLVLGLVLDIEPVLDLDLGSLSIPFNSRILVLLVPSYIKLGLMLSLGRYSS